jgi:hypothetical protein
MVGPAAIQSRAADHLDGPLVSADGRLDITDVYAFQSPANAANTVLIMGVDPLAGKHSPFTFHPEAAYDFKIDTNGDAVEDITYRITFSKVDTSGAQTLQLHRLLADDSDGGLMATGQTGTNIPVAGGGLVRAGAFDDPFFFDLAAFKNGLAFCPNGAGSNFFAGLNISAIVLEVPSSQLGGHIGVWARTRLHGQQIDRMGRPAINTVFHNHNDAGKDAFNQGQPVNDQRDFRGDVVNTLLALGNSSARANALADVLLPDILTFDTSSSAGFLNGRKLADDVIDAELNLITNGAVTSDCVANDSNFSNTFPYLASPN